MTATFPSFLFLLLFGQIARGLLGRTGCPPSFRGYGIDLLLGAGAFLGDVSSDALGEFMKEWRSGEEACCFRYCRIKELSIRGHLRRLGLVLRWSLGDRPYFVSQIALIGAHQLEVARKESVLRGDSLSAPC